MISHKHKFIYSHIPKCAGTSIESALANFSSKPKYGTQEGKKKKWLRNKLLFEKYNKYPTYFKFSFCRNPWDRMVSCFHFFQQFPNEFIRIPEEETFENFILNAKYFLLQQSKPQEFFKQVPKNFVVFEKKTKTNFAYNQLISYHLLPQSYFISKKFDFIGRFESLNKDFERVLKYLDLPPIKLNKESKSNHKPYQEYYNKNLIEIVKKIYQEDINRFNYSFETNEKT